MLDVTFSAASSDGGRRIERASSPTPDASRLHRLKDALDAMLEREGRRELARMFQLLHAARADLAAGQRAHFRSIIDKRSGTVTPECSALITSSRSQ